MSEKVTVYYIDSQKSYTKEVIDIEYVEFPFGLDHKADGSLKIYYKDRLIYLYDFVKGIAAHYLSIDNKRLTIDATDGKLNISYQIPGTIETWVNFRGTCDDLDMDVLYCRWKLNNVAVSTYVNGVRDKPQSYKILLKMPDDGPFYVIDGHRDFAHLFRLFGEESGYRGFYDSYLKERHLEHIAPLFKGRCNKDTYFQEMIMGKVLSKLYLENSSINFNIMNRHSHIMTLLVELNINDDHQRKIGEKCTNIRETYEFLFKELDVKPDPDLFLFKNSEDVYVKLHKNASIVMDTGNDSYSLVGANIIKHLDLQPRSDCLPSRGIGGKVVFDECVTMSFMLPYFGDGEYTIKAYMDDDEPDRLIFGWDSGLDLLFENGYFYRRESRRDLEKALQKLIESINLEYPLTRETEMGMTKGLDHYHSVAISAREKNNIRIRQIDYETLLEKYERNLRNKTLDLYSYNAAVLPPSL